MRKEDPLPEPAPDRVGPLPTCTIAQLREQLSDVINRAAFRYERIVITRRGKPIAAIVSIEDASWLEEMEEKEDAWDLKAIEEAREENERGETIEWGDLKKELGLE